MEKTTLAGGCFWCTEAIFNRLKGVISVQPGYSGGKVENPSYDQVVSGNTGHAESIQIEFDPKIIPFEKILEVFFATHDPTIPNQQGDDIGPQYRSVVFYHDSKQKRLAEDFISKLENNKVYSRPIVTSVELFKNFYFAEDYHKNYFERNKDALYCSYIISPKIQKLIKKFGNEIKEEYKEN